jgi:dolichyl-phosphate beta-glucosyltransferase
LRVVGAHPGDSKRAPRLVQGLDAEAPQLSIVLPAYDEAERMRPRMPVVLEFLEASDWTWEVILVDDGSRDGTAQVARELLSDAPNGRVISYAPNRGKGYAVRTGVLAARGRLVSYMDIDLSTPLAELSRAIDCIEAGADIVLGSRDLPESRIGTPQPAHRRFAATAVRNFRKALIGLNDLSDTQCGFKVMRREAVVPLFERAVIDRFLFDVELLYMARLAGLRLFEMPVEWHDVPGSKVRVGPVALELATDLARIRLAHGDTSYSRP